MDKSRSFLEPDVLIKFPIFRFLALLTIVSIGISSCAPAPAIDPTQTITATSTARPTETPIPATPTETVDPNIPPGATRKDAQGYWTKTFTTEKGNTLTYKWDKERGVWERQIFYGPVMPAALEQKPYGVVGDFFLTVTIDNTIVGEAQVPTIQPHQKWEPFASANWANLFRDLLFKQMENAGIIPNQNDVDFTPFLDGSHKFHFDFNTAEGPQSEGI
jgi:hypothetical protein